MEEIIKQAWIKEIGLDRYESLKDELLSDGFLYFQPSGLKNTDTKIIDGLPFYRPKSLKGIEGNNGWTKIQSEKDLPKEITECYIYDDDGNIAYYTFGLDSKMDSKYKEEGITHYQEIIKPEPPLY